MIKIIIYWITITRPLNLAIIFLTAIMGYLSGSDNITGKVVYFSLPLIFVAAAFYIFNDIKDIKEDSVNRPERILVQKKISLKQAGWFSFILLIFAIILLILHPLWLLSLIVLILCLWLYNHKLKSILLAGNFTTALVSSIPVIWGAAISGYINSTAWSIFFLAVLLHLIREIVKDIDDYEGDLKSGKKTTAVALGIKTSRIISLTLLLPCIFLMLAVVPWSGLLSIYWLIPQIILSIVLSSAFWLLLNNKFRLCSSVIRMIMLGEVIIFSSAFIL
ncbi:MAG: UbiA family prenyltransferase [bacterium]